MRNSSNHQYPDSFDSLSSKTSSGHIEHRSVDMDPHDRAVRRNAGRRSKPSGSGTSGVPLWLITILLFIGIVGFFLIRIPAMFRSSSSASVVEVTATEAPVEETAVPSDGQPAESDTDSESTAEGSTLIIEDSAPVSEQTPDLSAGPDQEVVTAGQPVSSDTSANAVHIHSYVNGVCSECGAKPEFITGFLPDEFYQESSCPGTVKKHSYDVIAYANHSDGYFHKRINIYLPYGYDETKPYNVLVLIHGQGGDEDSWLNTVYDYGERQMCGRVLFDNMIEKGLCEPCIIVTPVTETNQCQGLTAGIYQVRDELREYILPYIAENYSTYAADGSLESLKAARDHFALGGLSNGALFVFEGGMRYNFDLFGSYAAFSGNGEPWQTVGIIQSGDYAGLPVNCFFTGAGTTDDWQQNYTEIGYEYFIERDDRFVDGENSWRVDVDGGHEWKVWFTDIYNALPLMFQRTK